MNRMKHKGFTLIELMIVVAILGLLVAVGLPSYRDSVERSERSLAQAGVLSVSTALEQYYAENNTYKGATMAVIAHPVNVPLDSLTPKYKLSLSIPSTGKTYTIRAKPVAANTGNTMAYTLNSIGRKKSGPNGGTMVLGWQD